jgi:hypothetical protein
LKLENLAAGPCHINEEVKKMEKLAAEGFYYTNDEIVAKTIVFSEKTDISQWRLVSEQEAYEIKKRNEPVYEDE